MAPIEVRFGEELSHSRIDKGLGSSDTISPSDGCIYYYPPGQEKGDLTVFIACDRNDRGGIIEIKDYSTAQILPSRSESVVINTEKIRQGEEKRVVRGGKTILTARHVPLRK